jgi:hypothetical protein
VVLGFLTAGDSRMNLANSNKDQRNNQMKTTTKTNLILDIAIFTAFLVSAIPSLTGNTIHEWLGVSLSAAIVTHLLFHWNWLVKVTTEFFKNLFNLSRQRN